MTARPKLPEFVDFHFDVMCPYAYQTSRWIREVRDITGLQINWRFFSLEEINRVEGKKHPWEREWSYGWSMMRIGAYLRRIDPELLDRPTDAEALTLAAQARLMAGEAGLAAARDWTRRRVARSLGTADGAAPPGPTAL